MSGSKIKYGESFEVEHELDEIENAILNLAEEISKHRRIIEYKSLYDEAKRVLNFPKLEISNAINKLFLKKYVRPGSRLTKGQILENQTRNRIFEYIRKYLGAHVRELRAKIKVTPHILNWHLSVLEGFDYIYRVHYLMYVNFFPIEFDKTQAFPYLSLKNKNALRIFKIILKKPLLSFEDLKDHLNLQNNVISYHLDNLIRFSVIFKQEDGNRVFFGIKHELITSVTRHYNVSSEEVQDSIKLQEKKLRTFRSYGKKPRQFHIYNDQGSNFND